MMGLASILVKRQRYRNIDYIISSSLHSGLRLPIGLRVTSWIFFGMMGSHGWLKVDSVFQQSRLSMIHWFDQGP